MVAGHATTCERASVQCNFILNHEKVAIRAPGDDLAALSGHSDGVAARLPSTQGGAGERCLVRVHTRRSANDTRGGLERDGVDMDVAVVDQRHGRGHGIALQDGGEEGE